MPKFSWWRREPKERSPIFPAGVITKEIGLGKSKRIPGRMENINSIPPSPRKSYPNSLKKSSMVNRFSKEPINLVVFGATGDLMARKILPSLFYLYKEKKLPRGFRVIGVSRRDISEEGFRGKMRDAAGKFDEIAKDKRLAGFLKLFYFVKGYFRDRYTYEDLKRVLEGHDHKIFFYLAVAPKFYKHVLENMQKAGLIHQNMFLLVEKPIGLDLTDAREIKKLFAKYFKEEQIYRIDHYLAKSGMDELFDFRFRKKFLEDIWTREYISSIELKLWEKKDVGTRGEF